MNARFKTAVFYVLMILLSWATVEIVAVTAVSILDGRFYSQRDIKDQAEAVLGDPDTTDPSPVRARGPRAAVPPSEVIHPYVGVVLDPTRDPLGEVSNLGFRSGAASDQIWQTSDTLVIGIFGGSFAHGIYQQSQRFNSERIAKALGITDQEVVVVNFGKGGYKQPQQLMILTYLLSLGARFDIVVNIDGFNEVALPPVENIPRGLNPFYPRKWHLRAQVALDPETVRKVGTVEVLKSERKRRAGQLLGYGLHRSAVLALAWRTLDQRLSAAILDARETVDQSTEGRTRFSYIRKSLTCLRRAAVPKDTLESLRPLLARSFSRLEELQQAVVDRIGTEFATLETIAQCAARTSTSFTALGPNYPVTSEAELYQGLAGMWERSSFAMQALCETHGIRYYHFLQPNQYVDGSKPMVAEERRIALNEAQTMRRGVVEGYPPLRASGQRLKDRGVAFTDLTMIFENDSRVLYVDDCCHLSWTGYATVLNKILSTIAADN